MQEKTTNTEMTSMEASSSSTTRPPQERPSGHSEDGQKKNGSGPSSLLIRSMSFPGANGSGPSSRLLCTLSSPSDFLDFPASYLSAFRDTGPGPVLPNEADRGDGRIHGNQQEPNDGFQDNSRIHRNQQEEDFPRQSYLVPANCVLGSASLLLGLMLCLVLIVFIQFQKPEITMKSITFDRFTVSMGSDSSGLETYMASVDSTVKFTYRNHATFFGVYVTSITLKLNYSQLTLANGTTEYFYQSKKSQRTVAVEVSGNQIPMYASGASFIRYEGTPVPLKLSFAVSARAYILGSLIETRFYGNIYCSVIFDPKKLKVPLSFHNCIN